MQMMKTHGFAIHVALAAMAAMATCRLALAADAAAQAKAYTLAGDLSGKTEGTAEGNPVRADGKPLWRFDQVWPDDPLQAANYKPMIWNGQQWTAKEHTHGGQPAVSPGEKGLAVAVRGPWSGQPGAKAAAVSFIAAETGLYEVGGEIHSRVWAGSGAIPLRIIHLPAGAETGRELARFELGDGAQVDLGAKLRLYVGTVRLAKGGRVALVGHIAHHNRAGTLTLKALRFRLTAPPTEKDFVGVYDGHLYMNGRRVRFWSTAGFRPAGSGIKAGDSDEAKAAKIAAARAKNEHMVHRLKDMGFNMFRMWNSPVFGRGASPDGKYVKGDGSGTDMLDHLLWLCKRSGVKVWYASFGNSTGSATPEDVGIIDDAATAEAWVAAVKEQNSPNLRRSLARVWDPRLEALYVAHLRRNAGHVSQYTNLRYADDPLFAVWELTNEEWWIRRMVGGAWQKYPAFFKQELIEGWHAFLKHKYGGQEKLTAAWGFLMDGEDLEKGSVLLAPMQKDSPPVTLNDVNPLAVAKFKAINQPVGRDDFTRRRGADVLEYLTGLLVSHKQRVAEKVKTMGKSCALSPVIYDTGIGSSIQAQFMHQHADASVHSAYIRGTTKDPTARRYPFFSWLERYPRICYDVPWLEQNRTPGKPFFCYETQIGQPAKYRAEYPWKLIALAGIQDWDIISWHYYASGAGDPTKENPYDIPLSWPGPGAYQYHFIMDEVQMSAMRAAAEVFCGNLLKPAADPTTFIWGRKALYDPGSMDYGGSYGRQGLMNMLVTTYRHGVRLVIDPSRDDDAIFGPWLRQDIWDLPNPVVPTNQIEMDRKKGHIIFDAPGVAMYVGFLASYGPEVAFDNGVRLANVKIHNDEGIPYPVTEDEKFVSFCLTATDGAPLAKARTAVLSLVSTSFNTGESVEKSQRGTLPVLHARVQADVHAPAVDGMRYTLRDWHMRKIGEGGVKGGVLRLDGRKPVFLVELER
jgi:hypothetical protein